MDAKYLCEYTTWGSSICKGIRFHRICGFYCSVYFIKLQITDNRNGPFSLTAKKKKETSKKNHIVKCPPLLLQNLCRDILKCNRDLNYSILVHWSDVDPALIVPSSLRFCRSEILIKFGVWKKTYVLFQHLIVSLLRPYYASDNEQWLIL